MVVRGARRSSIYDLEKEEYHYVPNGMSEIIELLKKDSYLDVLKSFEPSDQNTIKEYITFLLNKDLGFFTPRPELYPDMELKYETFNTITNAIIDRNESSSYDLYAAIEQLDNLKCQDLQLRFYSKVEIEYLDQVMAFLSQTEIRSVEIFVPFNQVRKSVVGKFINKWPKIKLLLIHSAPKSEVIHLNKNNFYTSNQGNVLVTEEIISSENNCGCISKSFFSINVESYTESNLYNSCLHKKIGIDSGGNIRNCPSLTRQFGPVDKTQISDVILTDEFKSYSKITKDQINVCKDCEHRYMCTDCRAFVTDIHAKPAKCGYNPYLAKWETN